MEKIVIWRIFVQYFYYFIASEPLISALIDKFRT